MGLYNTPTAFLQKGKTPPDEWSFGVCRVPLHCLRS